MERREANRGNGLKKEILLTLKIGAPVILTQLLQMSLNFTDTIMAGRLSAVDLAAIAVGGSLFLPFMVFSMGSILAVNPIVAQNIGARRFHLIGKNVRQALWLSQLFALVTFFIIRNISFIMIWMDVSAEIIPVADGYLKAISWGMFPLYGYVALRNFNEGLSVTRPPMFIALIGALVNVPANYALMFGKWGFPQLGAVGTGYASAFVYTVMCISMIVFTANFSSYDRFEIFSRFRWPEKEFLKELLRIGLPIGGSATLEVTMFAAVSLLMGTISTVAVAAHQIAINFAALAYMIPFGISIAVTSRVGQSIGKGNLIEARLRGWVGIGICTAIMMLTASIMILVPEGIARIYTDDPVVTATALNLIFLAAIFQLSDGLQVSGQAALRGMKDTRIPMLLNMFAYGVIGLPMCYLLGITMGYGPEGMWVGLIIGLTLAGLAHTIRFHLKTRTVRLAD